MRRAPGQPCSSRMEKCYSSDRRLGGGGGCWYRTNFGIDQSSNNSKHNGNISSLSPPLDPQQKRSPLFSQRTRTYMRVLAGWRALIFPFFFFLSFPSFPFFYIYKCCVCHIIMNVMGLVGRAVGRLLYDCFYLLRFSVFSRRAV